MIAAALGISAFGIDPVEANQPAVQSVVASSAVTASVTTSATAKVLDWHYGTGQVQVEFSVVNQDGIPIEDLDRVQLVTTLTNQHGNLAETFDLTYFAGEEKSVGSLNHQGGGIYQLTMPVDSATPESTGIGYIRPGNGKNGMPRTPRIMLTKTDQFAQVSTTEDAKCVACHGEFDSASGSSAWGWHQHHYALDNEQQVVIIESCLTCHTETEKKDGGWANNTLAMIGHGMMSDGEGGKAPRGHANLSSNYSMDLARCSSCHKDNVEFKPTINGCVSCHTDLFDSNRAGKKDHIGLTNSDCTSCHASGELDDQHLNGSVRDEALNRYHFEMISVQRSEDKATIEVTVKATNASGDTVDISAIKDASPRGWATIIKHGEALLPGRDEGHVARSIGGNNNADGSHTYIIQHAPAYTEGEVLAGGVDGRINYANGSAPISVSNIKEVRRASSDGMKCLNCHTEGLQGHSGQRGGFDLGGDACTQCHSAYNWSQDKEGKDTVLAWGPFVHNIHFGEYQEQRVLSKLPTTDKNMPAQCVACHTGDIDLKNVAPAIVLNGANADSVYGITPIAANCSTCHTGDEAKKHMISKGANFSVEVNASGVHTGEKGEFTVFDPAPFTERCAKCHEPIDMAEAHKY